MLAVRLSRGILPSVQKWHKANDEIVWLNSKIERQGFLDFLWTKIIFSFQTFSWWWSIFQTTNKETKRSLPWVSWQRTVEEAMKAIQALVGKFGLPFQPKPVFAGWRPMLREELLGLSWYISNQASKKAYRKHKYTTALPVLLNCIVNFPVFPDIAVVDILVLKSMI